MPTYQVTWHLGQWIIRHILSGKVIMACGSDWYNAHVYCYAMNERVRKDAIKI